MVDMTTYAPPSDSMAVFCDAIRVHIRRMHISQKELAIRAQMKESDLSMRLNGRKGNCDLGTCHTIAKALGFENVFEMWQAAQL